MLRPTRLICYGFIFLLIALPLAYTHPHGHPGVAPAGPTALLPTVSLPASIPGVSGNGKMRFRVLYNGDHLPQAAAGVLKKAHGGFAIDRRAGKGEVYFALPGAGIIQISGDLKTTRMLQSPESVTQVQHAQHDYLVRLRGHSLSELSRQQHGPDIDDDSGWKVSPHAGGS